VNEDDYTMIARQLQTSMRGTVRRREPMAPHTTWRVGGPAELFIVPEDRDAVQVALQVLSAADCPWLVCGYGSNVLVRDGGIDGAVIHTGKLRKYELAANGRVEAEAGVPLMLLVRAAVRQGLAGIESLGGMPATIGGAVAMNAGAHGQSVGDVLQSVTVCQSDGQRQLAASACDLRYRHSNLPQGSIVVAARLQLQPGDTSALKLRLQEVLSTRRSAQAVGGANAGSVFKNPPEQAAWRLIDAAGLRGRRRGGASVSEKHANFIVNHGGASAEDIEILMCEVAETVESRCGIRLVPEVRIWGRQKQTGKA